ncbi:MAG: sigma-70 family RNA polymerase sigma factor [Actinobacteria bacterium]|nr:sigma-70 family RNA polymerase sigma factor [Actinomycetota bacterium]
MVARRPRPPRIGDEFAAILAGAQDRKGWAFERLYRGFAPLVAGYLRLQGSPEPDDLTNEVFLSAFGAIGTFRGDEDQFRSWLFTIAHRRLTDERRRRGRQPPIADRDVAGMPEAAGGDVEEEALQRLSVERVRRLCDRLSPDQRDVLLLRMVSTLSIDQIAEALGKSPTAVKALQRRALAAVRRDFDDEGVSR